MNKTEKIIALEKLMEKTKKKLSRSLSLAVEIFTVLLSICLGIVGYQTYYKGMIQKYKEYVTGTALKRRLRAERKTRLTRPLANALTL